MRMRRLRILGVDFAARERWGKSVRGVMLDGFSISKSPVLTVRRISKRMLGLTVQRDLRDGIEKGVMDPKWLVQLVQPEMVDAGVERKEVDAMEVDMGRNWDDALRESVCGALIHVSDWMETCYKGCPGC